MPYRLRLLCAACCALFSSAAAAAAPDVVASIAPVHGVVARVMAGVGTPRLLTLPGASPHSYALRPSDARALADADIVFWIGPELEQFLEKPLAALAGDARKIALLRAPGLTVLPQREAGVHDDAAHGHGHGHDHGDAAVDPHVWLDPDNAAAMADAIAAALTDIDAANAEAYAANAAAFRKDASALIERGRQALEPVRRRPVVVFHDAYQYFEARFGLSVLGAVAATPEAPAGPRRLHALQARAKAAAVGCVFIEPQFRRDRADVIAEATDAHVATLDPLGAALTPGPAFYADLIGAMIDAAAACGR